jgi:hypothetical protein
MKTSSLVSILSIVLLLGCASHAKDGSSVDAQTAGKPAPATSDPTAAATTTPAAPDTAPTGAKPTTSDLKVPPLPGVSGVPGSDDPTTPHLPTTPNLPIGVNPPPGAPANMRPPNGGTCYAQCLAPLGAAVNAFDACAANCADGDQACNDACWTASGCEANEAVCQQAYTTCDAQCPQDLGP